MRLNVSIPPLDALIIPKAVCECKTMRNLLANLSDKPMFNGTLPMVLKHIQIGKERVSEIEKESGNR